MDFRLYQKQDATFMYVLPISANEALEEYTLFSEKVLDKEQYQVALDNCIKEYLKIQEYEITHKEYEVMPMSLAAFSTSPNSKKKHD